MDKFVRNVAIVTITMLAIIFVCITWGMNTVVLTILWKQLP